MHALWSTASRAKISRRRTCLQATVATSALIRRSAPSPRRRRRVLMSDVFTACYTTIMATAAVLDATYKDKRRKELDQRIKEAKDGLVELMEGGSASRDLVRASGDACDRCLPALFPFETPPPGIAATLHTICIKPEALLRQASREEYRRKKWAALRRRLALPLEDHWWLAPPQTSGFEECLASEEMSSATDEVPEAEGPAPRHAQREPKNAIQMSKMTESINNLVDRLLYEAWDQEDETVRAALRRGSLDSGWNAIRMLRSDGYPRYGDPTLDAGLSAGSRRSLNAVNKRIMDDWQAQRSERMMTDDEYKVRREHFVAKICYNLLVCSVPPGIHNYNVLISGLSRIGETGLAQAVVDSFLYGSHLRPTQMTLVALLHHYRLKKDVVGFYGIIRRLTGHDHRGVGIRRKALSDVLTNRVLWNWAENTDVNITAGYVVERSRIDRHVLEAILDGLIDLQRTRDAAKMLVACMRQGWVLGSRHLLRTFWMCVSQLDQHAARVLVHGLLHNIDEAVSHLLSDKLERRQSLPYQMLHILKLYEIHFGPESMADEYSHRLRRLKRALRMRTALYELQEIARCARLVQPVLGAPGAHVDSTELLTALKREAGFCRRRRVETRRFNMLANIARVREQYWALTNHARWVLFSALPREERREIQKADTEPDRVSGVALKTILAQWSRYLATLANAKGPVPASATPALAEGRPQMEPPSQESTTAAGATSSQPASADADGTGQLPGPGLRVVASA